MKNLFLSICICVVISASGCATAGSGSCGARDFSLFQSSAVRNQPVRDYIRNWFRGDECDTCNAPAGLSSHCGSNAATLCESNVTIYSSIPAQPPVGQGVQLYTDPSLNIGTPTLAVPTLASPDLSSNLIDPLGSQGVNLGVPTGPIEAGYGSIPTGSIKAGYGEIPMEPSF